MCWFGWPATAAKRSLIKNRTSIQVKKFDIAKKVDSHAVVDLEWAPTSKIEASCFISCRVTCVLCTMQFQHLLPLQFLEKKYN